MCVLMKMVERSLAVDKKGNVAVLGKKSKKRIGKTKLSKALTTIRPKVKGLWIVTFRQVCPGTTIDPVANGRFFTATGLTDVLDQFQVWANDRHLDTSDIYATSVSDVIHRQLTDKGFKGPEDL